MIKLWNELWVTLHEEDLEKATRLANLLEKQVGAANPDLVRARALIRFLEEPLNQDPE